MALEGATGMSGEEPGERCTLETRFQAASISKHFVASSMMLLSERRALDLHDPVGQWWPQAPSAWGSMTIDHLLTHTSGLGHWTHIPDLNISRPPKPAAILERATRVPLLNQPGTSWAYSGVGYLLAAAIIEAASGQPYPTFVSDNVIHPLEMTSTTSGSMPDDRRMATGHRQGKPTPILARLTILPGTGDVWTTVGDLVHYAQAVRCGDLLSERSWRLMSQPHVLIDEGGTSIDAVATSAYGYGMYIGTIAGQAILYQSGDNPGF